MARGSVENVLTVLRRMGYRPQDYDMHINFPGGVPIDGPSAGISMATAIVSAINGIPVDNKLAMTGEVSIHGKVKPVGGVVAKVEAAVHAGVTRVLIPAENWQDMFESLPGVQVIALETVEDALRHALGIHAAEPAVPAILSVEVMSASPAAFLQADCHDASEPSEIGFLK
jgi:Lon-like ATP-dependent protease